MECCLSEVWRRVWLLMLGFLVAVILTVAGVVGMKHWLDGKNDSLLKKVLQQKIAMTSQVETLSQQQRQNSRRKKAALDKQRFSVAVHSANQLIRAINGVYSGGGKGVQILRFSFDGTVVSFIVAAQNSLAFYRYWRQLKREVKQKYGAYSVQLDGVKFQTKGEKNWWLVSGHFG